MVLCGGGGKCGVYMYVLLCVMEVIVYGLGLSGEGVVCMCMLGLGAEWQCCVIRCHCVPVVYMLMRVCVMMRASRIYAVYTCVVGLAVLGVVWECSMYVGAVVLCMVQALY